MTTCPAFNDRVAVDLPYGTTLYGRCSGCVFGDCSSAHEHFVVVDRAVWAEEASLIPAFYERFGERLPPPQLLVVPLNVWAAPNWCPISWAT